MCQSDGNLLTKWFIEENWCSSKRSGFSERSTVKKSDTFGRPGPGCDDGRRRSRAVDRRPTAIVTDTRRVAPGCGSGRWGRWRRACRWTHFVPQLSSVYAARAAPLAQQLRLLCGCQDADREGAACPVLAVVRCALHTLRR